jgi:hypothetical protein
LGALQTIGARASRLSALRFAVSLRLVSRLAGGK